MTCDEVQSQLPEFGDGDLPAVSLASIQQHLDGCVQCTQEQVMLARAWDLLDAFPAAEVASDFNHRFWKRVEAEPETWWQKVSKALSFLTRGPVRAVAVFSVMLVLLTALPVFHPAESPVEPPPVYQEEDTAHYSVLGDVADLAPLDDEDIASPAPAETPTDSKVDRLLEDLPLDGSGPQG